MFDPLLSTFAIVLMVAHFIVQTASYFVRYRMGATELSGLMMIPVYIAYVVSFFVVGWIMLIPLVVIWLFCGVVVSRYLIQNR